MTVRTMNRCVPASVPGIMFLSGGLTEEDASVYLNTMNSIENKKFQLVSRFHMVERFNSHAYKLGVETNIEAGQKALMARCQANSEASNWRTMFAGSQPSSQETLFEAGYKY